MGAQFWSGLAACTARVGGHVAQCGAQQQLVALAGSQAEMPLAPDQQVADVSLGRAGQPVLWLQWPVRLAAES